MRPRSFTSYWFAPTTDARGFAHSLLSALGAHGACIAAGGVGVAALVSSALTGGGLHQIHRPCIFGRVLQLSY